MGSDWENTLFEGTLMMRPVFGNELPQSIQSLYSKNRNFNIYPNPAKDVVYVRNLYPSRTSGFGDSVAEALEVTITNTLGQIIYTNTYNVNTDYLQIDVSTFTSGIYFIHLLDEKGNKTTKKLIISNHN